MTDPDMERQQGVIINGRFVEARMMAPELIREEVGRLLPGLAHAADTTEGRHARQAVLRMQEIYGDIVAETLRAHGRSLDRVRAELDARPPQA